MTTFLARRIQSLAFTLVCAGVLASIIWLHGLSLRDSSFLSGWILFIGALLLALLNVRKKVPVLPLMTASHWLQVHIYLGLLTAFVFFLHTSLKAPSGIFETVLWWSFAFLIVSGVGGLFFSRVMPNLIRQRGERVIYERIPSYRAELADEVEALAMRSVTESGSNAIASYYTDRLHMFFQGSRNFLSHLRGSVEPLNKFRSEIGSLQRYLNAEERAILEEIESRVIVKDDLDRLFTLQSVLKVWLFIHIPLTYLVLLLSLCHIVLVYAFATGSL